MRDGLLKIGQLARLTSVLPSTINFYTNEGLLRAADHSRGGYRLYDPSAVQRVKTIQQLQEEKRLTIQEIRQWLTRPRSRS
ncbi:MAG: MerR family transcriptional regulator [Patescibacteria group bacterium]|nr:MerR family transcriptional regulator [Patescibacteria group bacterium]